jgi:hypothetical protein
MKIIISSLLITFGLIFLGLSQRYDYHLRKENWRIDKLTGQVMDCLYIDKNKENICDLEVEGTGIFKVFENLN